MNGFTVFYEKNGIKVSVFAPTEAEAKNLIFHALQDPECSGIGCRMA